MRFIPFITIVSFLAGASGAVSAADAEWMDLYTESMGLYQNGSVSAAASLAEKALRSANRSGQDATPVMAFLGQVYISLGRLDEAERILDRVVGLHEGRSETEELGVSLERLASLYYAQDLFTKSEDYRKKSLAVYENVLGANHPHVATALNNLAYYYTTRGRLDEAEPMFLRALIIREGVYGEDHPKVSVVLNNLGLLYIKQKRYEEAEGHLLRAIEIKEAAFGPNHSELATPLNNIGDLYYESRGCGEALPLYQRAYAILSNLNDETHPYMTILENKIVGMCKASIGG
ncbi:MAG: tetratricopeptide repeat protein [Candidatus Omnitrophota bacterium]|nr:tetratricopeptide repeat protein [Candidatus Omnitrophota bacterium]